MGLHGKGLKGYLKPKDNYIIPIFSRMKESGIQIGKGIKFYLSVILGPNRFG